MKYTASGFLLWGERFEGIYCNYQRPDLFPYLQNLK